jgi:hypothetical protein
MARLDFDVRHQTQNRSPGHIHDEVCAHVAERTLALLQTSSFGWREERDRSSIVANLARVPFFYWGAIFLGFGQLIYFFGILLSILRLLTLHLEPLVPTIQRMLWVSGLPSTIGVLLVGIDLAFMLPLKRRLARRPVLPLTEAPSCTVVLTAYNDEISIAEAVRDFVQHPHVRRVIVVSNNSTDRTEQLAKEAGAIVFNEPRQATGRAFTDAFAKPWNIKIPNSWCCAREI